ncbi:MAG: single-stranded DNA-binding protein [Gemmatimonadetes bacterium]|jgi:single-strand selective monofunctional uracil DNA glycosylase|nr:single-stranded DNA-binding protein [Gemmatimonadota bacterium]MBT6149122.1 single-stranded DNA-binding protein [Gemmatimonadota bacterium]MBT7859273.1 single-stranded DNA-binding protein [Gemmatimonadota bacterium]
MPSPLVNATRALRRQLQDLHFAAPVTHVYNPLDYARRTHEQYLTRWGTGPKQVLFLGMNPGPFGMGQTGVPFGEIGAVRDWIGIEGPVSRPSPEHPKRPVDGFFCTRSEVSGQRLWSLFAERFGQPDVFFANHFVANYCPLMFMEASGRNRTPDKLPAGERDAVQGPCDEHLRRLVDILEPRYLVGVGRFARDRARLALAGRDVEIVTILHPSPASPIANRGWAPQASKQMVELGIWPS